MLPDHFDFLAPFYDRTIRPSSLEPWLKIALLPVSGILLDAGGGTGRVAASLSQFVNQAIVVDLSFGMLRQAGQKNNLECVRSPSENLPFEANTFERVVMVDAFHHIIDPKLTAAELWRVLRPGGRLVIQEPDIRTAIVKVVAVGEKLALMRSHFIAPPRIIQYFAYPNARSAIFREGYSAWIIIDKTKTSS